MFIASDLDWVTLARDFGVPIVMFTLILYGGFKRWWVWGYQLKDAERREGDWKDMALRGTMIAERASGREKWTVEQRLDYLERQTQRQTRRRDDESPRGH